MAAVLLDFSEPRVQQLCPDCVFYLHFNHMRWTPPPAVCPYAEIPPWECRRRLECAFPCVMYQPLRGVKRSHPEYDDYARRLHGAKLRWKSKALRSFNEENEREELQRLDDAVEALRIYSFKRRMLKRRLPDEVVNVIVEFVGVW